MRNPSEQMFLFTTMVLLVAAGTGLAQWNGEIEAWGLNDHNQCDVPSPNSGFVTLDGGCWHSLGFKADSSIIAWGSNVAGACEVPSPNSGFVDVSGGGVTVWV